MLLVMPLGFANNSESCTLNGIDYEKGKVLLSTFKTALSNGDKQAIAGLMAYPLRVNTAPGKFFTVKNAPEFIKKYDNILTADLIQAVQKDKDIFCNTQGAMIGSGIWFNTEDKTAKVFAISQ